LIYIFIISVYFLLTLFVIVGFLSHPNYQLQKTNSLIPASIIITARNEEENIEKCLSTIAAQNFPKELIEIILVDDGSTDATLNKATLLFQTSRLNYKIIQNKKGIGKKESLKKAINESLNELIITRDADTFTVSKEWLSTIVNYHLNTKKEFIICPVAIENDQTVLGSLQEVETAILSLFTISSSFFKAPFLCSGANLVFTKKIFYETKAYENHLHIPSGDDVFFLEEVKALNKNHIGYLKNRDAIVYTYPEKTIESLIEQKIRWSGKVFKSSSMLNWFSALIIALTNFTWAWTLFYVLFSQQNALIGLFFIPAKLLIDFLLVFLAASFIKIKAKGSLVLLIGCLYPLYASVIAILATLMKPKWKK